MNAMFSLLLRFCPRKIAGAPAITPAVISVRPTNSRRVIPRADRIFAEGFIDLPSSDNPLSCGDDRGTTRIIAREIPTGNSSLIRRWERLRYEGPLRRGPLNSLALQCIA
jgi:hypothetical protein